MTFIITIGQDRDFYGIDWNGPIPLDDDTDRIQVPDINCDVPLNIEEELASFMSALGKSENYGIDLYCSLFDFLNGYAQ